MEPDFSALRAEARRLLEERQSSEFRVHLIGGDASGESCSCERCKRGIPPGPNDWTINVVHVGGEHLRESE